MADISIITLPNGNSYNLKDAQARKDIAALQGYTASGVVYEGTTTTALADGLTTPTFTVTNGTTSEEKTAVKGTMVSYNNVMYAWNGDQWDQLGSAGAIKALAYKDSASADYTPEGSVSTPIFTGSSMTSSGTATPKGTISQPTFTGSQGDVSVSGTPSGTVSAPAFTGTKATISVSGTPKGTVAVSTSAVGKDQKATYTPAGSVAVTPSTGTVKQITGVGTLPSLTTSVANETLTLGWNAGTLPTSANATVLTGASATFTGTGVMFNGAFTGQATTSTGDYTPAGSNGAPTFTGKDMTATGKFTPAGSVSTPTFTGTAATVTVTGTTAGSVSKPTFTGTKATITSK